MTSSLSKASEFISTNKAFELDGEHYRSISIKDFTEICQALIDAVEALEQYGDYHWQDCSIAFSDKCDCGLPKVAKETLNKIGGDV